MGKRKNFRVPSKQEMARLAPFTLAILLAPTVLRASERSGASALDAVVEDYCIACHNDVSRVGGMSLEAFDLEHPEKSAELAEKMIRKLRAGLMPPAGMPRPEDEAALALVESLERGIDAARDALREPGSRPSQR
ncbi:MAG: hypothetical protein ACRD21_20840, partial [Vicinamibacteria bacterium]